VPRDSEPHTDLIGYLSIVLEASSFEVHQGEHAEKTESDSGDPDFARSESASAIGLQRQLSSTG
jgi:hypothetical protein